MIIFDADDPLVRNGTYDREGYTPKERRAQARKRQQLEAEMAKKKAGSTHRSRTPKKSKAIKKFAARTHSKRPTVVRRPRSVPLPGLEDARIKPLDDIAAAYAEIRDQRIALNKDEHELKATALKMMKRYKKVIYKYDGIEIRIVPGEDDLKVKVKAAKDLQDDGPEPSFGEEQPEAPPAYAEAAANVQDDPTPF